MVDCTPKVKAKQPLGAIKVKVECAEVANVTAGGKLVVRSRKQPTDHRRVLRARSYKLKTTSVPVASGQSQTLSVKLPRRAATAAKKALSIGGKAEARLTLGFADLSGNQSTQRVRVTLRRRK